MQEIDMINKAFSDSVFFHTFFMYCMPIPFLLNLYTLFTQKNYSKIITKLWFVMILIFFLIAVASFSGIFVWAMNGFTLSYRIWLMIIVTFFIFLGEIWRIKKLKLARTQENLMISYINFAKLLYGLDLLWCIVLFLAMR